MKIELYQAETEKICLSHVSILEDAGDRMIAGKRFSLLEEKGLIHTLQILIENAIGKGKHVLKYLNKKVPVSGYDVFETLSDLGKIKTDQLTQWHKIIGLRNNIVHEYMTVNMEIVFDVIKNHRYRLIADFLVTPFEAFR